MPQVGIFPWSRPMPHDHSCIGMGGFVDPTVIDHDLLNNFVGAEHLALPDIIVNVLTDHNKVDHDALGIDADTVDGIDIPNTIANVLTNHTKAVHDALAINADQVDGIEGAWIIQRDGSVPLTGNWDAGNFFIRSSIFTVDSGGLLSIGETPNRLRIGYNSDGSIKVLGVDNDYAGIKMKSAYIAGKLSLESPTELTINAGAITATKSYHTVDGQGDAADDLVTINGGVDGQILVLQIENAARNITLKVTGNIRTQDGGDHIMSNVIRKNVFIYDGTNAKWAEFARCNYI